MLVFIICSLSSSFCSGLLHEQHRKHEWRLWTFCFYSREVKLRPCNEVKVSGSAVPFPLHNTNRVRSSVHTQTHSAGLGLTSPGGQREGRFGGFLCATAPPAGVPSAPLWVLPPNCSLDRISLLNVGWNRYIWRRKADREWSDPDICSFTTRPIKECCEHQPQLARNHDSYTVAHGLRLLHVVRGEDGSPLAILESSTYGPPTQRITKVITNQRKTRNNI